VIRVNERTRSDMTRKRSRTRSAHGMAPKPDQVHSLLIVVVVRARGPRSELRRGAAKFVSVLFLYRSIVFSNYPNIRH